MENIICSVKGYVLIKVTHFRHIIIGILIFFIIGIIPIIKNLYTIHTLDPENVIQEMILSDQKNTNSPISDMPIIKEKDEKKYIYFFGGSSLVNSIEDDHNHQVNTEKIYTFPNLMNDSLNKNLKNNFTILNYGKAGIDSVMILRGIKEVVASKPPMAIAYYLDHDDYTESYKKFIGPKLSLYRGSIFKIFLSFDKNIEDKTFAWLMDKGLLNLDPETFDKIDTYIEQRYVKTIQEIAKISQTFKIKFIMISPVHNLFTKKLDPELERQSDQAIKKLSSNELVKKLTPLKEIDWANSFRPFLYSTQIKLKSIAKQDNVYLINLREILTEKGHSLNHDFIFNHSIFYQKSHTSLANTLLENNIFKSCLQNE